VIFQNVKKLCDERGVKIARLEREAKLGNGTIKKWETATPSIESVRKVAEFFGVTIDSLVSGGDDNG
jgi:transcriptional regulator with XRE-family HTH domain